MSNITQADIDRAMEIINTPFGGNRGMAILSKSNYMYLCGMVQAMTKRIAELEAAVAQRDRHIEGLGEDIGIAYSNSQLWRLKPEATE